MDDLIKNLPKFFSFPSTDTEKSPETIKMNNNIVETKFPIKDSPTTELKVNFNLETPCKSNPSNNTPFASPRGWVSATKPKKDEEKK